MKLFKYLLIIVLIIFLIIDGLLVYFTIKDYSPESIELIDENATPDTLLFDKEYSLLIWNIGYAGLSEDMDFFYDGGVMVRPIEMKSKKNLNSILSFLNSQDSIDFYLLQEIDVSAKRSYNINQYSYLKDSMPVYKGYFAKNYNVEFVPLPWKTPMGKVISGMATFSKNKSKNSSRYPLPGNYSWPKKIFMHDRCFIANEYLVSNNKSLVVINTHNSAYDADSLRKLQVKFLKDFALGEYNKGKYVIIGGDWNQCPPDFKAEFSNYVFDSTDVKRIETDSTIFDWNWVFDSSIPTNRQLQTTFIPDQTKTTTIDFYLLSPNIELLSVETIDLGFKNSDHNPVISKIRLQE